MGGSSRQRAEMLYFFSMFYKQNRIQSYIISFENETKDIGQKEGARDEIEIKRERWGKQKKERNKRWDKQSARKRLSRDRGRKKIERVVLLHFYSIISKQNKLY